jgi:predicted dehydrogenase
MFEGAVPYTDLAEMLKKADIDAVDICTPSGLHAEMAIMALKAGKHVLTEKPIDIDIKKVDELLKVADETGLKLACIFQNRFTPELQRAKQLIDEGKLGKIISASTYCKWYRGQNYYDSDAWRGTWALDGGVLSNQAIHSIDQFTWLAGPAAEVEYAHIDTVMHEMEAEDFALAVVRFENGARGVIEATTCSYPGFVLKTELFGTKGSMATSNAKVTQFKINGEDVDLASAPAEDGSGASDPMAIGLGGHALQLHDFVQCIREDREPLVSGRAARVAVDLLNKIYAKCGVPKVGH